MTVITIKDGGEADLTFAEAVAVGNEAKIARGSGGQGFEVEVGVRDEVRHRHAMRLSAGGFEHC